jgi:hypothetical protein
VNVAAAARSGRAVAAAALGCGIIGMLAGPAAGTTAGASITVTGPVHGTFTSGCEVSGHTLVLGRFTIPVSAEVSNGFNISVVRLVRSAGTHAKLNTTKNYEVLFEYAEPGADWGSGWAPPANGDRGRHEGSGTLTIAKNLAVGSMSTTMIVIAANPRGYRKVEHVRATWNCT